MYWWPGLSRRFRRATGACSSETGMPSEPLTIEIAPGRRIGDGQPCFVIAEIASNHDGDFERARALVDAAADCGVDAVKVQTFRAEAHFSKYTPGFSYLNNVDPYALIQRL